MYAPDTQNFTDATTHEGFDRLVREHAQAVYAFLAYRTGDPDLAEDLLADALERAFRHRRRFDPRRASERTWLISIALNRWRDIERRRAGEARALERLAPAAAVDDPAPAVVQRRALLDAVASLPEPEREVIALVYGADLTAKQAATVLGVRLPTVNGRLYRGLERLRRHHDDPVLTAAGGGAGRR